MDTEFLVGPRSDEIIEIGGSVGKGCKDTDLFVPIVNGLAALLADKLLEINKFGITSRINHFGVLEKRCESLLVFYQLLLPADKVQVFYQYLDLVADQKILKFLVVGFDIFDGKFADSSFIVIFKLDEEFFDITQELSLGKRK
jgi:hypothetical protein